MYGAGAGRLADTESRIKTYEHEQAWGKALSKFAATADCRDRLCVQWMPAFTVFFWLRLLKTRPDFRLFLLGEKLTGSESLTVIVVVVVMVVT